MTFFDVCVEKQRLRKRMISASHRLLCTIQSNKRGLGFVPFEREKRSCKIYYETTISISILVFCRLRRSVSESVRGHKLYVIIRVIRVKSAFILRFIAVLNPCAALYYANFIKIFDFV